jgi:Glycosyltransferase family 9 (heptosyltransferase)
MGDLHQTLPVLNGLCERFGAENVVLVCCDDFAHALPKEAFFGSKAVLKRISLAKWARRLRRALAGEFPVESIQAELPAPMQRHFALTVNLTHDESSAALMELMESDDKRGRVWSAKDDIRLRTDWAKYLFALVQNRWDNLFNLVDIQLGIAGLPHKPLGSWLALKPESVEAARDLLLSRGWNGHSILVAVQLGASDTFRALGPKKVGEALSLLKSQMDFEVVCLGTDSERHLTEEFCQAFTGKPISLNGQTSMSQLPAVLKHCALLMGNDTGTLHAAASVGTTCLGFFFATAYYTETAPYGAGHVMMQAALECSPCTLGQRCLVQKCRKVFQSKDIASIALWMLQGQNGPPPGPFPDMEVVRSRFAESGALLYEPLPGWPVTQRYSQAQKWRDLFATIFEFGHESIEVKDALNQGRVKVPVAGKALTELAQALEEVADVLGEVYRIPVEARAEIPNAPALVFSSQLKAAKSMKRLHQAQEKTQVWGRFLGFDVFDLPEKTVSDAAALFGALQSKHREWADRTRLAFPCVENP